MAQKSKEDKLASGESERLWECPWWDWDVWEPRVSPNGEQLTFGVTMVERNVWMLTEF